MSKTATLGCEGCNNEVVVPLDQETCPICGAALWEDDIPDDLPPPLGSFIEDLP